MSVNNDSIEMLKQHEKETNQEMISMFNCEEAVYLTAKTLDVHLQQVLAARTVVEEWMQWMNIPNKQDVTDVAVKIIKLEDKADQLEEKMFELSGKLANSQNVLTSYSKHLRELKQFIESETDDPKTKREMLENELEELKQLF